MDGWAVRIRGRKKQTVRLIFSCCTRMAAAHESCGFHAHSSRLVHRPFSSSHHPLRCCTTHTWRVIEEILELSPVSLKQVNGAAGAADGADQIGAGLALKAFEGVLLGIGKYVELSNE